MIRPFHSRSGFTLIEVLLATLISSILAGATYSLLAGTGRARKEARVRSQREREIDVILERIAKDVSGVLSSGSIYDPGFSGIDETLDGFDRDQLEFLTLTGRPRLHSETPGPDLLQVVYQVLSEDDEEGGEERTGSGLFRRIQVWVNSTELDESEQFEWRLVSEDVLGLNFRYYDGSSWQESWDTEASEGVPVAIEISIRMKPLLRREESQEEALDREEGSGPPVHLKIVPLRVRRGLPEDS